jgi:hypothetical protein
MNIRYTMTILLLAALLLPAAAAAESSDTSALANLQSRGFFRDAQGNPLSGDQAVSRFDIADWVHRSLEIMAAARTGGALTVHARGGETRPIGEVYGSLRDQAASIGGKLEQLIERQTELRKDLQTLREKRHRLNLQTVDCRL